MQRATGHIGITGLLVFVTLLLTGCGGTPPASSSSSTPAVTYSISGSITGLSGTVVLQNNGTDTLTVTSSSTATFTTSALAGSTYNISVLTQPVGQTCTVSNGNGTVSGNVTNLNVSCTNNSYTVGGNISGLSGTVVLQNNSGDNLALMADGSFTFGTPVLNGNPYNVTVLNHPAGQTCTVSTGAGDVSGGNVNNVAVICSISTYSVGGTVSGLAGTVVLQVNNGSNLSVTSNGNFTFATSLANASQYSVSVFNQPAHQSCSVGKGNGFISANVTDVTVTCETNKHTISGTVTGLNGSMVLQNNGGDNLTVSANGNFAFATAVTYGNPYSVSLSSVQYPDQTCTIGGGSGTTNANVSNVAVACVRHTVSRFAYAANFNENTVSMFTVNAATGQLRSNGHVTAGVNPWGVTVEPSGKFAYVSNYGSANLYTYAIDAKTGMLTQFGAPVSTGNNPVAATIDQAGKFAYISNSGSASVSVYAINTSTGSLTEVPGSPFTAGSKPGIVTIDPSGKFAYIANAGSANVSVYTTNNITGTLTEVAGSPFAAGSGASSIAIHPAGKFAFVTNRQALDYLPGSISLYAIDATNGALTSVGLPVLASFAPNAVKVDHSGKFAYVSHLGARLPVFGSITAPLPGGVKIYAIDANSGALTDSGLAVAGGSKTSAITFDASGTTAYVVDGGSGDAGVYSVDGSTGALTLLSSARKDTGNAAVTLTKGITPISYTPKYTYVVNAGSTAFAGKVSAYTINATTGVLDYIGSPVTAGTNPVAIAADPAGKFAFVANYGSANVTAYTIGAGGALTEVSGSPFGAGTYPNAVTVDPSGKYVYVANAGSKNVWAYTINASSGALSFIGSAATGNLPSDITVAPDGKYAYVTNQTSGNISAYSITPGNGTLVNIGTIGADLTPATPPAVSPSKVSIVGGSSSYPHPSSVTVSPSGKFSYVTNTGNSSVSVYSNSTNGLLATSSTATAGGTVSNSGTVSPSGKFAYVVNTNEGSVSVYAINAASGVLTEISGSPFSVGAGTRPGAISIEASGKFAYIYKSASFTVAIYAIDAVTGALTKAAEDVWSGGVNPLSIITTGTFQ